VSARATESPALREYLERHFAPGTVSPVSGGATGASNDTAFFSVMSSGGEVSEYVLRAQTVGHQLFYDVDVLFQARVQRGLTPVEGLPVPGIVLEEPDASIVGTPFFVMERIAGRDLPVSTSFHASGWLADATPQERVTVWRNAVATIARIGQVDWRSSLPFLDAPRRGELGLDRYLSWVEDWYAWAVKGRPQPTADVALAWIREHQPADAPVELVWGDATMANMLWGEDLSPAAVLDWEMAALGPSELDLGWFLFMHDMYAQGMGIAPLEGFLDDEQTAAVFLEHAGRSVQDMHYYKVLGGLRMAIVIMRFSDLQIGYGNLPADTNLGTNNPATNVLASYLDLPIPENASALAAANEATVSGRRGGS
jgi:aminoglycoside phosphotransferase (APT) family kinase protein